MLLHSLPEDLPRVNIREWGDPLFLNSVRILGEDGDANGSRGRSFFSNGRLESSDNHGD
jgi:hypothetical protein